MKKPIAIIVLILLIAAGSVGALYATGNLEGVVDKIFNRSEVLDMSDEKNFDEILAKVKSNLDEVKSVRAEVEGSSQGKIGDNESPFYSDKGEINFVFPNKKSISFDVDSSSGDLEFKFGLGTYEQEAVILGENIYMSIPWLPIWIQGISGQSMPVPISDTHGSHLMFDLNKYPEGWDFTKNIEKIEEYLGVEEINGIKYHRYKVKVKKIPYTQENLDKFNKYFFKYLLGIFGEPLQKKETSKQVLEQKGDKIRFARDDKEMLIPIPVSLTYPTIYTSISKMALGYYVLNTWGIDGEIWIGENDFLIHKERYTTEKSNFYYDPNKSDEENRSESIRQVSTHNIKITYSNFNKDIKIEAPTDNVITVDGYMKQEEPKQIKTRDTERKRDLSNLAYTLEKHYKENNQYPVSNGLEKTNDKNCVLWDALIPVKIPVDLLDPEFYYTYKSDGQSYELVARLENLEDEDCVMENDICLYKCKDGVCGK